MSKDVIDLTCEQRYAATTTATNAVVSAGPGSGKTRVIAARVEHLVRERSVCPSRIACLVFTRSAAEEIRTRVAQAVGPEVASRVVIDTFHGLAARYVVPPGFRVATEAEEDAAVRSLLVGPTRRPSRERLRYRDIRRAIVAYEACLDPASAVVGHTVRRLQAASLVPMWALVPFALVGASLASGRHVLVDEAQDCTPNERLLATMLARGGALFAVLDDRQAIMGWRGAAPWEPDEGAERISLTRAFRFGPRVADCANVIASLFGGERVDGDVSIASVVEVETGGRIETSPGIQTAVLCRTHAQCAYVVEHMCDRPAVHVTRDPVGDPFSREADRVDGVWRDGAIVVSTVHAFKGREADHVICTLGPDTEVRPPPEELRVLYVAITRARYRLTFAELPEGIR